MSAAFETSREGPRVCDVLQMGVGDCAKALGLTVKGSKPQGTKPKEPQKPQRVLKSFDELRQLTEARQGRSEEPSPEPEPVMTTEQKTIPTGNPFVEEVRTVRLKEVTGARFGPFIIDVSPFDANGTMRPRLIVRSIGLGDPDAAVGYASKSDLDEMIGVLTIIREAL